MAKSLVERYEQLLAQDPASSVFVELAKALIAQGEPAQAIPVCEQGISHHPQSVTGRVLWGKALILLGRPAEAMAQFDQAIAIDKENPHAYNLISEVLLQRGLYRSALPILRKAAALQPNDGRVRGWMEQTQAALSGGPAPAFDDLGALEPASEEEEAAAPSEAPKDSGEEGSPGEADQAPAPAEIPVLSEEERTPRALPPTELLTLSADAAEAPLAREETPAAEESSEEDEDPFDIEDTASSESAPEEEGPDAREPEEGEDEEDGEGARDEAASAESSEVALPFDEEPPGEESEGGGLLGDLPPLEEPAPARRPVLSPPPPALVARLDGEAGARSGGLLEELPELPAQESEALIEKASAPTSRRPARDVGALASAYERELREKLLPRAAGASFLSGRTLKIASGLVALVVLLGALLVVRLMQGGQAVAEALGRVERMVAQDSPPARQEALSLLSQLLELDEDNGRAWALTAYAHALRYADGATPDDREQALFALGKPGVREAAPALALAVDVLVAEGQGREAARGALLKAQVESSEVHALAGGLLLEEGKVREGLARLEGALRLSPHNARALVRLAAYYRDAGDPVNALKVYETALKASPSHPGARIGIAESRLALGEELAEALADMERLAGDETLPAQVRARQRLVHGRLLTAQGRAAEARRLLTPGTEGPLALESLLALGEASRADGDMAAAQEVFEKALALKPDDEEAKAGVGRALLDRDREREALSRLEGGGRKVALVRAAAYARLGEWKRVRAEVARTRVEDAYPPEAVIYLALADAADGARDKARDALEKTLAATKTARAEVRAALGLLHVQERALDKASTLLEEAVAEGSRDYEAPCALGRLLVSRGLPDLALKPLKQAVERNGSHGEAREALGRALLALGRTDEAIAQFEAWQQDNPGAAAAHKGFSLALYQAGRMKEAEEASGRAVKLAARDAEAHRVRAAILFASGDMGGGFKSLESSNKLDSKSADTFCEIALAFLRQGITLNAAKAFEAARREGPEAPCGRVGEHWVKSSGGPAAAKVLEGISEKASTAWDKAFAQAALARVLLEAGSLPQARSAADEAVRLAPFSGRSHFALGLVALAQKDAELEVKALSRTVELEPTHGLAWLALGDALARKPSEAARAVEAYQSFLRFAGSSPEAGRVNRALPALERRVGK